VGWGKIGPMAEPRRIFVIGVPMDLGQQRRGVDMGPSAIRYAGLHQALGALGYQVIDLGDVPIPLPEHVPPESEKARHLGSIAAACRKLYERVAAIDLREAGVIFLGGDHALSIGSVAAVAADRDDMGVLWVDAHGDFNTPETTPSGNVHGMALAALMGLGAPALVNIGRPGPKLRPDQAVLLGVRDLDPPEREALRAHGVRVFTMRDVDERGMAATAREALACLAACRRIHVSLDMDVLDPAEAPGVGTPVAGGLTCREAHLLMEILHDSGKACAMDIVEVNPVLDERNRTAQLAVALAESLFGKVIF